MTQRLISSQKVGRRESRFFHLRNGLIQVCCFLILGVGRGLAGPLWLICGEPEVGVPRYYRLCPALLLGSNAQGRASPTAAGGGSSQLKAPSSKVLPKFPWEDGKCVRGPQLTPVSLGYSSQPRPTSRLWLALGTSKLLLLRTDRPVPPAFPYQPQLGEPEAGGCRRRGEEPGL